MGVARACGKVSVRHRAMGYADHDNRDSVARIDSLPASAPTETTHRSPP